MPDFDAMQRVADENFAAFQKLLPNLTSAHSGQFALMRNGEAIEFFDSAGDAMIYGRNAYSDGLFSIQQVTKTIVDLGFFSHAVHFDPV